MNNQDNNSQCIQTQKHDIIYLGLFINSGVLITIIFTIIFVYYYIKYKLSDTFLSYKTALSNNLQSLVQ